MQGKGQKTKCKCLQCGHLQVGWSSRENNSCEKCRGYSSPIGWWDEEPKKKNAQIWVDSKRVSAASLIVACTETDTYRRLLEEQERELVEGKATGIPVGIFSKI